MSDGRTVWWPKDSAWWRREHVVELGEEFGADGPAVLDWLSCEAKAQNDGGSVKSGCRSVARGCFVDVVTVSHVLSRAVQIGALDDYQEQDGRFVCRISGWQADQERGRAAVRQAAKRERERAETPANEQFPVDEEPVIDRDVSRPVTPSHGESLTGQERREDKKSPPDPPEGGRKRALESWKSEMTEWVAAHPVTDQLLSDWAPIRDRLAEQVDEVAFTLRIAPLHPHANNGSLILGGPEPGFVSNRFGRVLAAAAGTPVQVIDCGCQPAAESTNERSAV